MITYEASLPAAAKCALLSFDATMRSNLSVAPPLDLLCHRADSLRADVRVDIQESDPYFTGLRAQFGEGMLELFDRLPAPAWIDAAAAADD